ncbi:helix-turn-helix domain-containing protein [Enterococcus malodoratus]|uniref:helix-turn-helix domain-containing protein n=1 Tax=Enterococcus malodoratus TaxID=71451 RepID=UPI0039B0804F
MHIGDKIYKLRRLNNETMNDLVKQTGLSQSWLSDIESGKKQRADFNKICAIAKHYEVSLEYFQDDYLDSDEHEDIIPLTGETRVKSMKSLCLTG